MLLYASAFEVSAIRLSFPALSSLSLTTCVIKHRAVHPIERRAKLLMLNTHSQTQRLIDSAMVHCLYNYPARRTSHHPHRYKVHLPTFLHVNHAQSVFIEGCCRGTFDHRGQVDSVVLSTITLSVKKRAVKFSGLIIFFKV